MHLYKIYSSLLCSIFFTILPAQSAVRLAAPPVLIGFDIGSPPLFDLKNGCATGIYPLIVETILTDAGQSMLTYSAPFNRILNMLDAGELGAGGILKTPQRERKYDFSEPIFVEEIAVYYNKINSKGIAGIGDLKGKRVGVIRGWSYGDEIDSLGSEKYFIAEAVSSDVSNFKKLQLGRIDALFTIREVGLNFVGRGDFSDIVESGLVVKKNKSYIAFSKKYDNSDLIRRINFSINRLKNNGTISRSVNRYLKSSEYVQSGESHVKARDRYPVQLNQKNCAVLAAPSVP